MQERFNYIKSEIANLKPSIMVEEGRGDEILLNGFAFNATAVEEMIQLYRQTQEDLMADGASEDEILSGLADTKLSMISSENWNKIADTNSNTMNQLDLVAKEEDKVFIGAQLKQLTEALKEENDAFKAISNRRLIKGKVLARLIDKLTELEFKDKQGFIRSQVEKLGLKYAGALSTTEISIVTKVWRVFFEQFGDSENTYVEDSSVTFPDSELPQKFCLADVAVNNMYALCDLVGSKESRDRLAAFAYRNTEDACRRLKRASKTNASINKEDPAEIHEPLPVKGDELLDFFDRQTSPEEAFEALAEKANEAQASNATGERKSELVNITLPRFVVELVYNADPDKGIKGIIENNYPRKNDIDPKTGIHCSVSDMFWLLWRMYDKLLEMPLSLAGEQLSPQEILEKAFREMREEDESDGNR